MRDYPIPETQMGRSILKIERKLTAKILGLATLMSVVACSSAPKEEVNNISEFSEASVEIEIADDNFNRLPASQCHNPKYTDCKEARKNDIADRYMLDSKKNLYRRINGLDCAVTSNVQDFKISQHPNDVAVLYFKKAGDLYMVNKDKEYRPNGQCPSAKGNTKVLMQNVAKYTVTSNINTTIVNAAVDHNGYFVAWDDQKPVYKDTGVEEFQMNSCFGTKDKSFNSYVLFTRHHRDVTKVKVSESGKYIKDSSAEAPESYDSIKAFSQKNKVCK